MTYNNEDGPIYSMLGNKGDACCYSSIDGESGQGDAGFNGCGSIPNKLVDGAVFYNSLGSYYKIINSICYEVQYIKGCITSGISDGNADMYGNQEIAYDIGLPSIYDSGGSHYPQLCGTCGYRLMAFDMPMSICQDAGL
jgi:hypothetical protein